jgi:hypothetical protein
VRRLFLMCTLLTVYGRPLPAQRCPVKPYAAPFQQEVSTALDHFEWYSAYAPDPAPGNGNDFDRHVRNLGGKLLKYDWPIGGLYNFGLPPGKSDSVCINYGRVNAMRGKLFYGRLDDAVDTSVYRGEGEPPGKNVMSRFNFFFSEAGADPQVEIDVESRFDGKTYSYSLRNVGSTSVRVAWHHYKIDLFEELRFALSLKVEVKHPDGTTSYATSLPSQDERKSESAISEELKKGRTLEPGQAISGHRESDATPSVFSTNLDVGSSEGRPLAGAVLPILVPGR